jgi:multiple antibiotic resistance protein
MLDFALTAIASILFVVDPPGALPTYLVISQGDDPAKRRRTAWRASLVATVTLAVFAGAGNFLFRLFGVSMPAFQIAGGLILFLVALDMIRAQRPTQEGPGEINEGSEKPDVAITPLAVPMLAGPAAISTVTMLMSRAVSWAEVAIIYLAILLTGIVIYVTLRLANPLYRGLGKTGIQVFSRVLGLILAAIAVEFVLDGLTGVRLLCGQ